MPGQRTPWTKGRFFLVYWAVQAPLVYAGWGVLAGGFGPRALADPVREPGYAACCACVLASIAAMQAVFLFPVSAPREGPDRPWSRAGRHALAAAAIGLMAALGASAALMVLGTAAMATTDRGLIGLGDLPPWSFWAFWGAAALVAWIWLSLRSASRPSARLSVVIAAMGAAGLSMGIPWVSWSVLDSLVGRRVSENAFALATAATFLVNWAIATPVLLRFVGRRDADDALGRIAAWLFTGTVIEASAVIPLDVMVRRKSSCYCGEGTLWTLTICWGVGILALGPAVWLIPLARRRKRWYGGHCPVCDYDMSACMAAERCPECGAGWRPAAGAPEGASGL